MSHTVDKIYLMENCDFRWSNSVTFLASNHLKLRMGPFYPFICYIQAQHFTCSHDLLLAHLFSFRLFGVLYLYMLVCSYYFLFFFETAYWVPQTERAFRIVSLVELKINSCTQSKSVRIYLWKFSICQFIYQVNFLEESIQPKRVVWRMVLKIWPRLL